SFSFRRSPPGVCRKSCCIPNRRLPVPNEPGVKRMKQFLRSVRLAAFFLGTAFLYGQGSIPEIPYDSAPNLLKLPERLYLGEGVGVATNSKGHIVVYTRAGSTNATIGASRIFTHGGARLFEFGPDGRFLRELGQGLYGFMFAHVVRVDPQDNIWAVDEG